MAKLLFIATGGACGSLLRYACAGWVQRASGGLFPLGTFAVNILGCLGIGFVGMALSGPVLVREEYRLALLVGLFGGFTTFSSFGWETFGLMNDGQWWRAAVNVLASNTVGVLCVWLGYRVAEWFYGG
jgi:fluoride exporter